MRQLYKTTVSLCAVFASTFVGNVALAGCPAQTDCIVVVGVRNSWGHGIWGVNLLNGTNTLGMETATFEDIDDNFVPVVVPQRHRIDINGNGTYDAEFAQNFIVYGLDTDGDGAADFWEDMVATGAAWPF